MFWLIYVHVILCTQKPLCVHVACTFITVRAIYRALYLLLITPFVIFSVKIRVLWKPANRLTLQFGWIVCIWIFEFYVFYSQLICVPCWLTGFCLIQDFAGRCFWIDYIYYHRYCCKPMNFLKIVYIYSLFGGFYQGDLCRLGTCLLIRRGRRFRLIGFCMVRVFAGGIFKQNWCKITHHLISRA